MWLASRWTICQYKNLSFSIKDFYLLNNYQEKEDVCGCGCTFSKKKVMERETKVDCWRTIILENQTKKGGWRTKDLTDATSVDNFYTNGSLSVGLKSNNKLYLLYILENYKFILKLVLIYILIFFKFSCQLGVKILTLSSNIV